MREQERNSAAACACMHCLFSAQVVVSQTPHALSIKTTGPRLPQSEPHVFTKQTDTRGKLNAERTHFHLGRFIL